jgi:hypothetical protein
VIGASALLFALVVARMTGLVRQREKSVSRERALSAAGGLLVAATDPREIVVAALQAVADFGATRVDARVCRVAGAHVTAMALDEGGDLTEWHASGEISELLCECRDGGLSVLPASARDELRLPANRCCSSSCVPPVRPTPA